MIMIIIVITIVIIPRDIFVSQLYNHFKGGNIYRKDVFVRVIWQYH